MFNPLPLFLFCVYRKQDDAAAGDATPQQTIEEPQQLAKRKSRLPRHLDGFVRLESPNKAQKTLKTTTI